MAKGQLIEVGKPFPGKLNATGEGCKLHVTADPPIQILALFPKPTARELYAAQSGTIRVGLVDAGVHTFFMLLNLGRSHWADMPYAVGLLPPDHRPPPRATPERGYATIMALIDEKQIVRTLRMFSITPQFSLELDRLIKKQLDNLEHFTPERHANEITAAYERWPYTNAMVKDAVIVETAGEPFPHERE